MTATSSSPSGRDASTLGVGVAPRRQRRWSLALVAVLVILGSALAFAVLWMNAGERRPVLALARDVSAGQVLRSSDLEVVRVAADPGVELLDSDQRGEVIGQTALSDLVSGSLLSERQLGEQASFDEGRAVVGVWLRAGEMPTSELRTGSRVMVVQTASGGGNILSDEDGQTLAAPVLGVDIAEGTVHRIEHSSEDGGGIHVSVLVDEGDAARIAGASAAGESSLVLLP